MTKRIVVAMSGGVDSSVVAALLKKQGYDVIGMALQVTDYSKYHKEGSSGTCCSLSDMDDARRVAERIDIPFYVINTEKAFDKRVVDYFIDDYLQGHTPNPCVMCNTRVKFDYLYRRALELGASHVATGHYAQVVHDPRWGHVLKRGADPAKDQSYFLFDLSQNQLSRTMMPLGGLDKSEVRKMAEEFELEVASKPDSQEICFVPKNDYARFVEEHAPAEKIRKGHVVTECGTPLATHDGIHRFTIGQRKGLIEALNQAKKLKLKNADSLYVTRIDPEKSLVILGSGQELFKTRLKLKDVNWIVSPESMEKDQSKGNTENSVSLEVKIRYRSELVPANIELGQNGECFVSLKSAQRAVTPGQACVFYHNSLVVGGGWIKDSLREGSFS